MCQNVPPWRRGQPLARGRRLRQRAVERTLCAIELVGSEVEFDFTSKTGQNGRFARKSRQVF
jgi:hypothetical protein